MGVLGLVSETDLAIFLFVEKVAGRPVVVSREKTRFKDVQRLYTWFVVSTTCFTIILDFFLPKDLILFNFGEAWDMLGWGPGWLNSYISQWLRFCQPGDVCKPILPSRDVD